jgi:phage FluMu protein Com
MPLTNVEKQRHLQNPNKCPYCQDTNIESDDGPEMELTGCYQTIRCSNCEKRWTEIYRMIDIEEIED